MQVQWAQLDVHTNFTIQIVGQNVFSLCYIKYILLKKFPVSDFSMVAKLTKEPKLRKKNTEDTAKPPSSPSRSSLKQALRLKCNTLIHYETTQKQGISACCYTIHYFLRPTKTFFQRKW